MSFATILKNPNMVGALFQKDYALMDSFFRIAMLLHQRTASKRIAAAQGAGDWGPIIPEDQGFVRIPASSDPITLNAVNRALALLSEHDVVERERTAKKAFLIQVHLDLNDQSHWPIFQFALSKHIVDPITAYLGILPVLSGAHVWYSPNKVFESGRSQEFHLDAADARQVKVFLFLDEIDESTGPLTAIPAHASQQIYKMLREQNVSRRLKDKIPDLVIFDVLKEIGSKPTAFTGKSGDVLFIDTSRCMHFGSRPSSGKSKPRKVVMLQYQRPYAPDLPLFGRLVSAPAILPSASPAERERIEYLLGITR